MKPARLTRARGEELLARCRGVRIAVIGDVFLDRYLVGRAERLSREAPVPVLAFDRSFDLPGGAANPARNLAVLGVDVVQVGVVGDDAEAVTLRHVLADAGIEAGGLVVDAGRPTTLKTRIVAEGQSVPQQVARIDRQSREPLRGAAAHQLLHAATGAARSAGAVLMSHYQSGAVSRAVCDAVRAAAVGGVPLLAADAQGNLELFRSFDVVRVGRQDAGADLVAGISGERALHRALQEARARMGVGALLLGRGPEGTSVADASGVTVVRPGNVSQVYDVAGAGDTVIAVTTAAMVAGAGVREAVVLASAAAGVAVRRLGVAAPTAVEILSELDRTER